MNNQVNTTDNDNFLDPKDLAQAFEHTMHFVKGNHESLPDMMHHTGRVLMKLSNKLSTSQMVLLVGALTLGAVFMVKRAEEAFDDDEQDSQSSRKALPKGNSRGGSGSSSGSGASSSAGNSGNSGSGSQKGSGQQSAS